jgi:hypothetical protein
MERLSQFAWKRYADDRLDVLARAQSKNPASGPVSEAWPCQVIACVCRASLS